MSAAHGLLTMLAVGLVLVITWRCLTVLRGMYHRQAGCHYFQFLAFGLSYVTLAVSAIGAAIIVAQGDFNLSHLGFLFSSAGLILFDRRKRVKVVTA